MACQEEAKARTPIEVLQHRSRQNAASTDQQSSCSTHTSSREQHYTSLATPTVAAAGPTLATAQVSVNWGTESPGRRGPRRPVSLLSCRVVRLDRPAATLKTSLTSPCTHTPWLRRWEMHSPCTVQLEGAACWVCSTGQLQHCLHVQLAGSPACAGCSRQLQCRQMSEYHS